MKSTRCSRLEKILPLWKVDILEEHCFHLTGYTKESGLVHAGRFSFRSVSSLAAFAHAYMRAHTHPHTHQYNLKNNTTLSTTVLMLVIYAYLKWDLLQSSTSKTFFTYLYYFKGCAWLTIRAAKTTKSPHLFWAASKSSSWADSGDSETTSSLKTFSVLSYKLLCYVEYSAIQPRYKYKPGERVMLNAHPEIREIRETDLLKVVYVGGLRCVLAWLLAAGGCVEYSNST